MAFNRKILKNFDISLLINVILICVIGLVGISSATDAFSGGSMKSFMMQIAWIIVSLGMLFAAAFIDYNTFKAYYKVIYIVNIALLGLVVALGKVTNGANSWIGLGNLGIQPSEFMKVSLIIVFAKKIEEFEGDINNIKNLGILAAYAIVPIGLIAAQPDIGTAMVFAAIVLGMLFIGGLDLRILLGGIGGAAAAVLAVWFSPVQILLPYMKNRVLFFFNPSLDPQNKGYQAIQSRIAVGSGELFGMGYGQGIQNQGKFVSESSTDFIFSVLGEEFGFIGAVVLILLYISLIFKCLQSMRVARDKFGYLVVAGIISMFVFQIFQNIGMNVGLMPITGITLPFVSYGGSSMLTSMISIGLVLNIGMRRHKINF